MTVRELKEILNKLDENAQLTLYGYDGGPAELDIWEKDGENFTVVWDYEPGYSHSSLNGLSTVFPKY